MSTAYSRISINPVAFLFLEFILNFLFIHATRGHSASYRLNADDVQLAIKTKIILNK